MRPAQTAKNTVSRKPSAASGEKSEAGFSFHKLFERMTEHLPERSRAILRERFGVESGTQKTLEAIGENLSITRERVRQIIRTAIEDVRERHGDKLALAEARILETLRAHSGVMHEKTFYRKIADSRPKERGAARFFTEGLLPLRLMKATRSQKKSVAHETFDPAEWERVHEETKALLKKLGQPLTREELERQWQKSGGKLPTETLFHYLSVSREVRTNVFGNWGLSTWSDIRPKGAREKAYLVLKIAGKPLHFREIARKIDEHRLQKKGRATHPQTVHNELIKDDRFVLVGRGMYALAEWGYQKGTVREVLADILKKAKRPLERDEVLDRIMEVRTVKKSTVIINLNSFFERVGKNAYTVKK